MALEYTEEKLNSLDKEAIIQLFLVQQEQLKQIGHHLHLVLEQLADLKFYIGTDYIYTVYVLNSLNKRIRVYNKHLS